MNKESALPQSTIAELLRGYLQRVSEGGLLAASADGEVVPYDASSSQPLDAKQAWTDACAVISSFGLAQESWPTPPGWANLVAGRLAIVEVPYCLGNYPQLMHDIEPLLEGKPANGGIASGPNEDLLQWANQQTGNPQVLMAAGVLRLQGQFAPADKMLQAVKGLTDRWQEVHCNEKAALLWMRGQRQTANQLWREATDSAPVHFNRGMASLFSADRTSAERELAAAVRLIPETSPWHHLAQLYLTIA